MIEFKADCGHTVRAKNEDEGKQVRCSYCGRETLVPVQQVVDKDLDFLFRELEDKSDSGGAAAPPKKKSKRSAASAFPSVPSGTSDVFGMAMKMVYLAVVLMILIVVGKMYVMPFIENATAKNKPPPQEQSTDQQQPQEFQPGSTTSGLGLQFALPTGVSGIYVDSVPPGARMFVQKKADLKSPGDPSLWSAQILGTPQSDCNKRARDIVQLNEAAKYVLVCTLPISHAGLKPYPNYRQFRQAVEGRKFNDKAVTHFLVPDRADFVGATEFRDEFLVYRVYEVDVAPNQWSQVVALFLPPVNVKEMIPYLPLDKIYNFDVNFARDEMNYYQFNSTDQSFLIQALERVGGITYHQTGGDQPGYYWISVGLGDGAVRFRNLEME